MATIHRIPMPGRDTCAGTCETEVGCTCLSGCEGMCQQGRLSCHGRPLPMSPMTRAIIGLSPAARAYLTAAGLVAGLVALILALSITSGWTG